MHEVTITIGWTIGHGTSSTMLEVKGTSGRKASVIPHNLTPNREMLKVGPAQLQIYRSSEPLKSIFIYTKRCGKLKATSKN